MHHCSEATFTRPPPSSSSSSSPSSVWCEGQYRCTIAERRRSIASRHYHHHHHHHQYGVRDNTDAPLQEGDDQSPTVIIFHYHHHHQYGVRDNTDALLQGRRRSIAPHHHRHHHPSSVWCEQQYRCNYCIKGDVQSPPIVIIITTVISMV